MVKLNVLELLEKQGRSKYWLYKQLGMSYQNFNRMVCNETQSINPKTKQGGSSLTGSPAPRYRYPGTSFQSKCTFLIGTLIPLCGDWREVPFLISCRSQQNRRTV